MCIPDILLLGVHAVVFGSAVAVRLGQFDVTSFVFTNFGVIRPIEMSINFHFVAGQSAAAVGVAVEQRLGLGNLYFVERAQMAQGRSERAVWRLVLAHEKERLGFVASVKPGDRLVGGQICCVTGKPLPRSVLLKEDRIVIATLCRKYFPVVEALRCCLQMPLADDRRVVATFLKCFGHHPLALIHAFARVSHKAILVAMLAGQNGRS